MGTLAKAMFIYHYASWSVIPKVAYFALVLDV